MVVFTSRLSKTFLKNYNFLLKASKIPIRMQYITEFPNVKSSATKMAALAIYRKI